MESISAHVSYDEATKSQTAIRLSIDNTPPDFALAAMKITAEKVFEPLRALVSQKRGIDTPITISSFYRCPKLNGAIGGAASSQHCKGEAIDMEVDYPDFKKSDLFLLVKEKMTFDQMIWEFGDDKQPAWVHVSWSATNNRREILKAIVENGSTRYIPFP